MDEESGEWARGALIVPGLTMLPRVDSEVKAAGGARTTETRYFATSLDLKKYGARELLSLVRGHWQVENGLHFIKDRWREDKHWLTRADVAEGFVALITFALTLLRVAPGFEADEPVKARADQLNRDARRLLHLLTSPPP